MRMDHTYSLMATATIGLRDHCGIVYAKYTLLKKERHVMDCAVVLVFVAIIFGSSDLLLASPIKVRSAALMRFQLAI